MAREFGEDKLLIATLPLMEEVVRGQFPKASFIALPIRKKRVLLNVFVANCIRCFPAWRALINSRADISISLRHMRDYLMNILFYSVSSNSRFVMKNGLLGNRRPVRRWMEWIFVHLFRPNLCEYPVMVKGIPSELEANRMLASEALGRRVEISEIWPELHPVGKCPIETPFWICAPFSGNADKDFPLAMWVEFLTAFHDRGKMPSLLLTGSAEQSHRLNELLGLLVLSSPEMAAKVSVRIPSNLQSFIDLLAGAAFVLTVDTGAAHAATALDCKTLVFFSGQHKGIYGPWVRSSLQRWVLPGDSVTKNPWNDFHDNGELLTLINDCCAT